MPKVHLLLILVCQSIISDEIWSLTNATDEMAMGIRNYPDTLAFMRRVPAAKRLLVGERQEVFPARVEDDRADQLSWPTSVLISVPRASHKRMILSRELVVTNSEEEAGGQ